MNPAQEVPLDGKAGSTTEASDPVLRAARAGISSYLTWARETGRIDQQLYEQARQHTFANLKEWLENPEIDEKRPRFKEGIRTAIREAGEKLEAARGIIKTLKEGDPRKETAEEEGLRGWEKIVNAFRQHVRFGTGGIRGLMAFDRASIIRLKEEGIDASILKGPNTINDLVFLLTSAGVAKYGRDRTPPFEKIVIGYDSRVGGQNLARLIARLFLKEGYTVYLFDEPCPYPEVTFAVPYADKDGDVAIKADVGILISASHNDYRYNGYKLSCGNGSQFDPEERDAMYNEYIQGTEPRDIALYGSLNEAPLDKLYFLGGDRPAEGADYAGREGRLRTCLIDIHARHREHVRSFFLTPDLAQQQRSSRDPLRIGFCAFHGAGRIAVPRLLKEVGFTDIKVITHRGLNDLDGLFPSFNYREGQEQQPDPGDPRSAEIMVEAFNHDYPGEFARTDIIIGTDPDADRCGVVVKVPENQRHLYPKKYRIETDKESDRYGFAVPIPREEQPRYPRNDYTLLPADDAWALLLWYRLMRAAEKTGEAITHGKLVVPEAEKKFVTLSHTTSDSITFLARQYGIGVVRTWVGFASLAAATRDVWDGKIDAITKLVEGRDPDAAQEYAREELCHPFVCDCQGIDAQRSINIGAMEQSNGFSILGGPPRNERSLGEGGHVRDKDGTFAALLLAEVAAWAKENGTTLFELIDQEIYLDPQIGLFVNLYEPDPLDGEYPGIEGDRRKKAILRRALGYFQLALAGDLEIGGVPVQSATIYRTGKYDAIYPPTYDFRFPDEGIRFFFDEAKLNHLTIRPSGTGNALRFHIQLHDGQVTDQNELIGKKETLHRKGAAILDGIRELLKAPRV
jgi:phosphomannomutase